MKSTTKVSLLLIFTLLAALLAPALAQAATVKLTVSKSGTGSGTITSSPTGINCGATCSANFTKNGSVKLTAAASIGSTFSRWSGACTGTASTCTVTMNVAKTVTASFTPVPVQLTVIKAGTGTGTVTSFPAGIDCGVTCAANFNQNSAVTLTESAAAGSMFSGWSGACTGTASTCTVTLSLAKTVTASFTPVPVQLTVTKAGTGAGTVTSSPAGINCGATCTANFNQNSSVTLTAAVATGSTFAGWSGACTGTVTICTVTMNQAQNVTASFTLIQMTLSIAKTGTGTGTVTSTPAGIDCGIICSGIYNWGTPVTLTATPATGSTFNGWSGACAGTAATCTVTMSQAQSVTASFAPMQMTLSVTKTGTGTGAISSTPAGIDCGTTCSGIYNWGTPVTLTATPATGSTFNGWSGACTGTAATCTVTMNQAQNVTANFTPMQMTLSVAKIGTGLGTITSLQVGIDCGVSCSAFTTGALQSLWRQHRQPALFSMVGQALAPAQRLPAP